MTLTNQHQPANSTRNGRASVVVLGSLNMDMSITVAQLPRPGETVLAGHLMRQPGGKGANQAVSAARLGGDVRLIGRLGTDDLADTIHRILTSSGVDLTHVRGIDDPTGQAFVAVDAHGENSIIVAPGANAQISAQAVEQEADVLRFASIAVTQLETPMEAVERFAELCEEHGVDLILNAAPYQQLSPALLRRCRFLVLNRDEASSLTGVEVTDRASAVEAALATTRMGVPCAVITLGGAGCVAHVDGDLFELDAYAVPVVDTTGAGDAFVGALAAALARQESHLDALTFAAAAGAVACSHAGAQGVTSLSEVRRLMREQPRTPSRRSASLIDAHGGPTPEVHPAAPAADR